ncbi:D-alanyl-D-alanine carboxypeptidase [hydrothermal vent metagenome]|uniref:D-alanyl-D-alanine carboxypeptidase n=1 Tax=hydrothermal vent metagenome TaxID=652676 RepID=A0A3B1E9B6_9ZZZZ
MNRRNFLTLSAISPILASDLFARTHHANSKKDVYLSRQEFHTLISLKNRLRRVRKYIGFANFNLVSFNNALFYGRNYPYIGKFTKLELKLIDKLFYESPREYGFHGNRTSSNINNKISKKNIKKIPRTGHYLFKDTALLDYKRLQKDIGPHLVLTSGIRNIVKQLDLYCNKIYRCRGNMTKASHSIAPPGYSYHTISDFDVGKKGWGTKNFTSDFTKTIEFSKMTKLDYIDMRYTINNKDGVRFEPWHVKVI